MSLEEALPNYLAILDKKQKPKFLVNKKLLTHKTKEAFKILEDCTLCERKCHVNRIKGEAGFCGLKDKMLLSSMFEHMGEEAFLVPSFTIFFWSCSFHCQFCQNWTISRCIEAGVEKTEEELAEEINKHKACKNMNFVGGEPTMQLPFILKTLESVKVTLPVIWNSNFYMTERSMELLSKIVDVYLSDFKYGNDKCAERLSKVPNYFSIIKRNHLLVFKDSELIIRHLVMPNHVECCSKPILDFIKKKFKRKVIVNIMNQYYPCYKAKEYPEINRRLTEPEFQDVVDYAKKLNLNYIV